MAVGSLEGGGRESVGDVRRGKNACQTAGQSKKLIQMPSGGERARATVFFFVHGGCGRNVQGAVTKLGPQRYLRLGYERGAETTTEGE